MKINDFRSNSDYATLKNDTRGNTISLTVNAGTIYNPSSNMIALSTLAVGTKNAGIRARGFTTRNPIWVTGTTMYGEMLVSIPSNPGAGTFLQTLYINLERINATTMRLSASAEGFYTGPDFKIEDTQTITFIFSTFLSPFA